MSFGSRSRRGSFLRHRYLRLRLFFRRKIARASVSIEQSAVSNFEIGLILLHGFIKSQRREGAKTATDAHGLKADLVLD